METNDITIGATTECIKGVHNITHSVYYNVCNGGVGVVPHGTLDYLAGVAIAIVIGSLVAVIMAGVIQIIKEWQG